MKNVILVAGMVVAGMATRGASADGYARAWGWWGDGPHVPSDLGLVRKVVSVEGWQLAIKPDGSVRTWGHYYYGCSAPFPTREGVPVVDIIAGDSRAVFVYADGKLTALGCGLPWNQMPWWETFEIPDLQKLVFWGDIPYGVFRNGELRQLYCYNGCGGCGCMDCGCPTEPADTSVRDAAYTAGTFAVQKLDGSVRVLAGGDMYGLFNWPPPDHIDASRCRQRPADLGTVAQLVPGRDYMAVLRTDGTPIAWGYNFEGQCDFPKGLPRVTKMKGIGGGWAGGYGRSTALLLETGSVVMWPPQITPPANLGIASDLGEGTGSAHVIAISNIPARCPGNLVGYEPDNFLQWVNGEDLGALLANWGPVTSTALSHACDLDGNGEVDGADLGVLLNAWGPCPN